MDKTMNEGHRLSSLERASVLAASDDPKDQDKAREIKTRFDYESLKRQIGSKKKPSRPAVKEAAGAGGGVPLTPQELEIQKKMSRLNVRLARKRNQEMQKAKTKDTETAPEQVKEGSLHKWFKGSKSKDGKPGWVNVKTGGTCASDEPGEGTPKCVSSAKRASMTKAERESASRRKKAADPNQQQKSGAAKPTYVRTDAKKKMNEDKVLKKVAKELTKASKMHKGQAEKIKKHADDMKKVEEVEVVTELKTSTLRNYVNKASIEAVGRGVDAGIKGMTGTKDEMEKNMTKAYKRQRGINRAANKLASRAERKEEVELDERLGGKGYKPYTSLTGKKVSGDWEGNSRSWNTHTYTDE